MAQQLKNIVRFIGIVPNTPTVLPHGLQDAKGRPLVPDILTPSVGGFTITADDTNVTVDGNGTDVDVLCEAWHTFERSFGATTIEELVPQPFIPFGGGTDNPQVFANFVFRPGDPNPGANVYTVFEDLYEDMLLVEGRKTLQFDDSLISPCVVPDGTLATGVGGTFIAPVGGIMSFDAGASVFTQTMVGRAITFRGTTTNTNVGGFRILSVSVDGTTVTYRNAGAGEANPGTWIVGGWDMSDVEWTGYRAPNGDTVAISILDGASVPNLYQYGGDIVVTNNNTVNAPVLVPSSPVTIEVGTAPTGVFTGINNAGPVPFFDMTTQGNPGRRISFRLQGQIFTPGTGLGSPAIDLGATTPTDSDGGSIILSLLANADVRSNMIAASNPAARIDVREFNGTAQMANQVPPVFMGKFLNQLPQDGNSTPTFIRQNVFPRPPAPPLAGVFINANGLGMNTILRHDTAAVDRNQQLPRISSNEDLVGRRALTAGGIVRGILNSIGMRVTIKNEVGANDVNVTGNTALATQTGVDPGDDFIRNELLATQLGVVGDTFTAGTNAAAGTVTLHDDSGPFNVGMVGAQIVITGGAAGQNGTFIITQFISATDIIYANPNPTGIVSAAGASWTIANTTLHDASGPPFTASHVGRKIVIAGATSAGNDGTFFITGFISATDITYGNGNGVSEDVVNGVTTWTIGDTVENGIGPVVVAPGEARSFASDGMGNWMTISGV